MRRLQFDLKVFNKKKKFLETEETNDVSDLGIFLKIKGATTPTHALLNLKFYLYFT